MNSEMWRPVVGYEGFYSVSNYGRVRSESRRVLNLGLIHGRTHMLVPERVMKPRKNHAGYLLIDLCKDGISRCHRVNVLVAESFVGPRQQGMQVCHNNGLRDDNRAGNLRYDTPLGNSKDKKVHGTNNHPSGEDHGCSKLTWEAVNAIRSDARPQRAIARDYGVSQVNIGRIKRGVTWKEPQNEKAR